MAIFDENGEYTEQYRKELCKEKQFLFHIYNTQKKINHFQHNSYREFTNLKKLLETVSTMKEGKMSNKPHPSKLSKMLKVNENNKPSSVKQQPPKIQPVTEVVKEAPIQDTVVVTDTIVQPVELNDGKDHYKLVSFDKINNFKKLNSAIVVLLLSLHNNKVIKLTQTEINNIKAENIVDNQRNIRLNTILFDKLSNVNFFDMTPEQYENLPQSSKELLL